MSTQKFNTFMSALFRSLVFIFLIAMFVLVLKNSVFAQVTKESISKEWVLKDGWFDSADVQLEIKDPAKHNGQRVFNVLKLNEDGTITYELYNPAGLGLCGNGLLYIDKGTWELKGSDLTIYVKGGHAIEDTFEYKIKYKVSETDSTMALAKRKEYISKKEAIVYENN